MQPTCVSQRTGVEKVLLNSPGGTFADLTAGPPRFNEQLWLQFCCNFYLLAISAHIHMSYVFPMLLNFDCTAPACTEKRLFFSPGQFFK